MVGVGIANAINTFDPEEVVLGGGPAVAGDLLLEPATRVARAYTVPGLGTRTQIRLARFHVSAGVPGPRCWPPTSSSRPVRSTRLWRACRRAGRV